MLYRVIREHARKYGLLIIAASTGAIISTSALSEDLVGTAISVMNQPSQLTGRAASGLFTSIAKAGGRLVAVGEKGRILVSADNGRSWRQVRSPTSVTLTDVKFFNGRDGWATGQMGVLLHSSDAGETWTKQLDGVLAAELTLAASKSDLATEGSNDVTTANMQAATQFVSGGPSVPLLTILLLGKNRIMVAGGFGLALQSNDGGRNWVSIFDALPNPNGNHIYALANLGSKIYVAGEQGLLLASEDGVKYLSLPTPISGSFFGALTTPKSTLLLFGLQGTVIRSTDGGKHWAQPQSGVASAIDCGTVLQNGDILLGDVSGDLLISHNNGISYSKVVTPEPVTSIQQARDSAVIIAGPNGLRRISENALRSDHNNGY